MASICRDPAMPCYASVKVWMADDAALDSRITRAREIGYEHRADEAIALAKTADDAALGRLAFDAERWYLGKLSNAFSDDKTRKHELAGKDGGAIQTQSLDTSGLSTSTVREIAGLVIPND